MTEQQITTIDENNMKARAVLKGVIFALEHDADPGSELDLLSLIGAAVDYLDATNQIFKDRVY